MQRKLCHETRTLSRRQRKIGYCTHLGWLYAVMHIIFQAYASRTHISRVKILEPAAYCYRPSSVVCLSVGRSRCRSVTVVRLQNGWIDRAGVLAEDSGGPKEPCIRWGVHSPWEGAILRGKERPILKYRDAQPWDVQQELSSSWDGWPLPQ